MKKKLTYLLILIVLPFTTIASYGQYTPDDALMNRVSRITGEKLTGLKKVSLKIYLSSLATSPGYLSEDQIQTEAEIRLRRAGLFDQMASSYIKITVYVRESDNHSTAYEIAFDLQEEALLERTKTRVSAETWRWQQSKTVEKNQLKNDIRVGIGEGIDQFIEDYKTDNSIGTKQNRTPPAGKTIIQPKVQTTQKDDSPFTATYVGGNRPPTIEIFNDSNRTMYFDFGQGKMTAYTIPSGGRQKIDLSEAGNYTYKASAPRVRSDEGQETFNKGYVYTWRFYIVTVPR